MSGIKRTPADVKFSRAIRERDGWMCRRCGSQHVPGSRGLHAAHCFTRRTGATRTDPENALALCYGCHQYIDSHKEAKTRLWVAWLGEERYDALAARAHERRDRV